MEFILHFQPFYHLVSEEIFYKLNLIALLLTYWIIYDLWLPLYNKNRENSKNATQGGDFDADRDQLSAAWHTSAGKEEVHEHIAKGYGDCNRDCNESPERY